MTFLETANFDWIEMLNFYERPFKAKLIPSQIWKDLDKYKNDSSGLSNYVKKWRTKVVWIKVLPKKKSYEKNVYVAGEYAPENRQCALIVYARDFNTFEFDTVKWNNFKFRIIQTLMHEVIHFMQYDRRCDEWSNYIVPYKKVGIAKKDAERRYLSEFDEIQAYAHCVFLDYKMRKPRVPIETLLARCKTHKDSSTLHYVLKTFNYDFTNNGAPRKIIDQIGKWDRKYSKRNLA
jgi:hypothetical protein